MKKKPVSRRRFVAGTVGASLVMTGLRAGGFSAAGARRKVLFDTDIGSDIDDAVALAYLLRQPRCELLGITTVTGDSSGRASLAASLCDLAGVAVPIFPGEETPLKIEQMQLEAPQTRRLEGPRREFPRNGAIEFLAETIRANPGEVTLLAVGPLTNIALLFTHHPDVPALLGSLVWMGGKYSDYPTPWGPTEWNAIVDPDAAHQVLSSAATPVTCFGLDITWRLSMTPAAVAERFRGDPLLERVHDWSAVWFEERELLHFHDPLAAVSIFDPVVATLMSGIIDVDLAPGDHRGVTHFSPTPKSNLRVASEVDADAFFSAYFSVLLLAGEQTKNAHEGRFLRVCGGGPGIRTPGTSRFNGFQDRRFRPLSQPTVSRFAGTAIIRAGSVGATDSLHFDAICAGQLSWLGKIPAINRHE